MTDAASKQPLAIVSAFGSRGDVNPMLALARELHRRGWRILFLTSAPYQALAEAAGFDSQSLVSQEEFDAFIAKPGLWQPVQGLRVVLGETATMLLQPTFDLLQHRVEPGNTILVTHPLDMASRIYRDLHPEVPLIGTVLAPMAIRTPHDPAKLTDWPLEISRPAWLVEASYLAADWVFIRKWLGRPVNRFRRQVGLPPIQRVLKSWYLSPDLVLGLFPDWFASHPDHWPSQLQCTGFPLEDAAGEMASANVAAAEAIREQHAQPPVIFAPGTANRQASEYFQIATDACQTLNIPAILLTEFPQQLPDRLPENVVHQSYLPFRALLPHCRAIVHHGGIGTTSQALAAGTPQLIVPMAFDQFDNARRVERLGCGRSLLHRKLSRRRLTQQLADLLNDDSIRARCHELRDRMTTSNTVGQSVDAIEQLAATRGVLPRHTAAN
ncbi:MurG-like transferase [Rosistilla carotiformis]|uniref:MurG-like transferase n=1 Tax=Rosistilla carotiformis TaxID=2528017 RepID=A0A518JXD9_9BACT|nr:nucleotide disphospho-sugar-binding domain-containing protein [Rosistilla carotiformis]QDV70201.1 MurG-like transferase [Rosistilla carotiformis]